MKKKEKLKNQMIMGLNSNTLDGAKYISKSGDSVLTPVGGNPDDYWVLTSNRDGSRNCDWFADTKGANGLYPSADVTKYMWNRAECW